jgi:phosphoribosylformimino-5-aminoimidazole carboxamide ribotide isomerase
MNTSSMTIIPAIDLLDGQVVRLFKGDYNQKKIYNDNPLNQAKMFVEAGFKHIHVVDLNGARSGNFDNLPYLLNMIESLDVDIQTGGGIRTLKDVKKLLDAGITKVICSSMAVRNPDEWIHALEAYPDQCILGMDLKDGKVAYGGWEKTTDQTLDSFLKPMIKSGLKEVLCTDISKDGTLQGPNLDLYKELKNRFPDLQWIASGGVSSLRDLENLQQIGLNAVVVGKAYYEGKISLQELHSLNH